MTYRMAVEVLAVLSLGLAGAARGDDPDRTPLTWETGIRYWYSTGSTGYDLYDDRRPAQENSRLTYDRLVAQSAEVFFRVEHEETGWFAKGNAGGGAIGKGHLTDEDFPVAGYPLYSQTISSQRGGSLRYLTLDAGREIWSNGRARIGAFAGYNFYREIVHAYGCTQVGQDLFCLPGQIAPDLAVMAQENNWHSGRLGLSGRVRLIDRLALSGDAAFIYSYLEGRDHHRMRPGIDPLPIRGQGPGSQVEVILDYPVTDAVDIGIGGRCWQFQADGQSYWGETSDYRGVSNSPTDQWSTRYGMFVQVSMRF